MQFPSGLPRVLPSRRAGALMLVVAAIVIATLIVRTGDAEESGPVARLTDEPTTLDEKDTDGDGVPDWEEALWGMSAVTQDTDGDGIGDAEEIRAEQARLEEERFTFIAEAAALFDNDAYAGLTETEKLSRGILEQVVAFESAGITLDGGTTNDIAGILGSILSEPPTPVVALRTSDLVLVPESTATLSAYAGNLGTLLGGEATPETNELLALAEFGQTGDTKALDSLTSVVATYDGIITSLSAMSVPSTLADRHVRLVNSFANTKESIALLSELGSDPVRGIQGLQIYVTNSNAVAIAFTDIREYLRSRITLAGNHPGYIIIDTKAN